MKRFLYYLLPTSLRLFARRLYFLPIDTFDYITGKRPEGVPPRGKIFIGHGDYVKVGERYLTNFKELCGLKPDHAVLDIGCGIGRMAVPLTHYLNEKAPTMDSISLKAELIGAISILLQNILISDFNIQAFTTSFITHLIR